MEPDFFRILYKRYNWKPIHGCPGRFLMRGGLSSLRPEDIVAGKYEVREELFPGAPDPVIYGFFPGGGLISYRKTTGFIHTLCNEEGMTHKMNTLKK